jgi:hypothetical protein
MKLTPNKPESNVQLLDRLMQYGCPTGALVQPFILQGIETYCRMVAAATPEEISSPLISGEAWKATGDWLQRELNKHFDKLGV